MRYLPDTDDVTLVALETAAPKIDAPWSLACPVKDCTLWRRDSRDLAGLLGALVVLEPGRRLRDRSATVDV
jgi:hypothetical protein